MSAIIITSKKKTAHLILSCLIALSIHVGALAWIKGWSWHWLHANTAMIESQQYKKDPSLSHRDEERNHQLARIFQELQVKVQQKNPSPQLSHDDLVVVAKENELSELLDLSEDWDQKNCDTIAPTPTFSEYSDQKQLPKEMMSEALQLDHHPVLDELLQVTQQIIGIVDMQEPAVVENGFSAGMEAELNILSDSSIEQSSVSQEELLKQFFCDRGENQLPSGPQVGTVTFFTDGFSDFKEILKANQEGHSKKGAGAIASSNDFRLQVEYAPKKDSLGYLFRLKLLPKEGASFRRIKHNLFFLIDRSHSIPKERYEASKLAVLKALTLLQEGDTFNILVFDHHIEKLAESNLTWNEKNLEKAYAFLKHQSHGGMFASTDLYSSLSNIIPEAVAEQEVNTAILISDGDTYLHSSKQRTAIAKWTKKNKGKVSLYSLACGQGNNLGLLDLLSAVNKGLLHYAKDNDDLAPTLEAMIQSFQNPIGKEITTTMIPANPNQSVTIFPTAVRLPNLYEQAPYVVYGSVNKLEDFHIFFQGKYYDKWLDIKQKVSFKDVQESKDPALERAWALQQAYDFYYHYLQTGDPVKLLRARQILLAYQLPAPL